MCRYFTSNDKCDNKNKSYAPVPDLFVLAGERMGWREGSKVKSIIVARCFAVGSRIKVQIGKIRSFYILTQNIFSHTQKVKTKYFFGLLNTFLTNQAFQNMSQIRLCFSNH